jgi:hypothetical protein
MHIPVPLCQFFQDYEKFSLTVILSNPQNPVNPDSKPSVRVNFTNDYHLVKFKMHTKLRTG